MESRVSGIDIERRVMFQSPLGDLGYGKQDRKLLLRDSCNVSVPVRGFRLWKESILNLLVILFGCFSPR